MNMIQLKSLIREVILQEFQMDKSIEKKIDEFGELSDQMDEIKHQLSKLKKRYGELEGELRPVLEGIQHHQQKSIQTERYLVTIKRRGYNRESYKYKESFEKSLTKVNEQTRRLLKELLESTKTTSRVLSSVGVQPVEENILRRVMSKIRGVFSRVLRSFRISGKELDFLMKLSKKMV
jgi:septal ring factor EnvC (AmiA/AmiB activator)